MKRSKNVMIDEAAVVALYNTNSGLPGASFAALRRALMPTAYKITTEDRTVATLEPDDHLVLDVKGPQEFYTFEAFFTVFCGLANVNFQFNFGTSTTAFTEFFYKFSSIDINNANPTVGAAESIDTASVVTVPAGLVRTMVSLHGAIRPGEDAKLIFSWAPENTGVLRLEESWIRLVPFLPDPPLPA